MLEEGNTMCYVANLLVVNQATVIRMVYKKLRTPKYTLEDMVKVENGSQSKDYRFFFALLQAVKNVKSFNFYCNEKVAENKIKVGGLQLHHYLSQHAEYNV